eukprot:8533103-Lingulodinium_polyedra.AAC.1
MLSSPRCGLRAAATATKDRAAADVLLRDACSAASGSRMNLHVERFPWATCQKKLVPAATAWASPTAGVQTRRTTSRPTS